jgi:hypothetical protein
VSDYIAIPGEFDFQEPECWGFNSYEHYKGQCRHQLQEAEDAAQAEAAALASEAEASQAAYDEWRSQ